MVMNILYAVIPERLTIKGALAAVVLALQTRPALAPISLAPHHAHAPDRHNIPATD